MLLCKQSLIFGLFVIYEFVSLGSFEPSDYKVKTNISVLKCNDHDQYRYCKWEKTLNATQNSIAKSTHEGSLLISFKWILISNYTDTNLFLTSCGISPICIYPVELGTLNNLAKCENMTPHYYGGHLNELVKASVFVTICRKIAGFTYFNNASYIVKPDGGAESSGFLTDDLLIIQFQNSHYAEISRHDENRSVIDDINTVLPASSTKSYAVNSTKPSVENITAPKTTPTSSKKNFSTTFTVSSTINTSLPTVRTTPFIEVDQKTSKNQIRGPYEVNNASKFIELALVIDNSILAALDKNKTKVYQRYHEVVNKANSYFKDLNIYVALVLIEILNNTELSVSRNINTTFRNFKSYAEAVKHQNKNIQIDIVHLISNTKFNDPCDFGISSMGNTCTEITYGVDYDPLQDTEMISEILAHEIIHNIGVNHDNAPSNSSRCEGKRVNFSASSWSSDTVESLKRLMKNENSKCLDNKPIRIFEGPVCGNSFIEPGEECDCGLTEKCHCCDAASCTLHANALCAKGECCDLKLCKFHSGGTECRPKSHDCDLPEYCDGQSKYCPDDVFKNIGESCADGPECNTTIHKCQRKGRPAICLNNCYGNGVCNSKGNCHCNDEFGPPACQSAGFGGSIDSGSARYQHEPGSQVNWNNYFMWIIGIVLFPIGLVLVLIGTVFIIRRFCINHYDHPKRTRSSHRAKVASIPSPYYVCDLAMHATSYESLPLQHRTTIHTLNQELNTNETTKNMQYFNACDDDGKLSLACTTPVGHTSGTSDLYQNTIKSSTSWVYDKAEIYSAPESVKNTRDYPSHIYGEMEEEYYETISCYETPDVNISFPMETPRPGL